MSQLRVHVPTDTYVHASRGLCGAVSTGHGEPDCKKCLEIQKYVVENVIDEWYVEGRFPDGSWLKFVTLDSRDDAEEARQQIVENNGIAEKDIRIVGAVVA